MYDDVIRLREEIAMQITALKGMKEMAKSYGYDISLPAKNAKEACQWLYFGYLAAIKTQNGAAMSVGLHLVGLRDRKIKKRRRHMSNKP